MILRGDMMLLFVVSFLLFFFGAFILYKDHRNAINRSFSFLAFSVLGWVVSAYFEDEQIAEPLRYLLLKLDFSFGIFFAYSLLLFCLNVAKVEIVRKTFVRALIVFVPILFSCLIFLTPLVVDSYRIDATGIITPSYGPLGALYDSLILLAPIFGVGVLLWRYRKMDVREKTQHVYLFIGLFLTAFIVLLTNVIFADYIADSPQYGIYYRLGIFSSIFIVLFPGYAMLRYRLLDMKIVATEILSFLILLVTFIQVFLAESMLQLIFRILIFMATFVLVGMLVRSVDREIRRKEELQEMADRLAVTNEALKRLDNSKSEFISIASHQLRTPLTAIKGFLSLILEGSYGKITPQIEDVINKVYSANSHLVELVENLLNISRIDSGRIQYQFEPTDIADIIRELADSMAVIAKGRGLDISFTCPETPIEPFLMDAQKIREVLSNLIDNAIKYTREGGISVVLERSGDIVRIVVSDTGVGIAPEDLHQLFQKFRRGVGAGKVNVSGTGLGLYVGKSFVDAHGGTISVESEGVGKGSRFIVELPFRKK